MPNHELHPEQTLEGGLLLWAADWLTVLLLAVGMVFPCLDAYGVSGRYGFDFGAVMMFCIFGSLAVTAMFHSRNGYWGALAVLAFGGLIFWRQWSYLVEHWPKAGSPRLSDLINESSVVLFLLYALVVLTLGWVVVRVRTWWLAAALVMLPLLPAFQAGVLPAWGAMLAGFAGWGSMLLTDLFGRKDQGSLARARFLSLGGMAALLLVLVMCLPMEGYMRPQWATDARTKLIQTANQQLLRFFDPEDLENNLLVRLGLDLRVEGGGTGTSLKEAEGPNAIESTGNGSGQRENLLRIGPRTYTGRQIMTLRTNQPGPAGRMYMRGVSFDHYTGTSWENSLQSEANPGLFPAATAPDMPEYTMTIRQTLFRGVWYYPYRFSGGGTMNEAGRITGLAGDESQSGLIAVEEMTAAGREEYPIAYRPGGPESGFTPLSGSTAAAESDYRNGAGRIYVSDDDGGYWTIAGKYIGGYLQVPAGLDTALESLVEGIRLEDVAEDDRLPEQFREPVAAAARTARYLASIAAYDPDTPAMEPSEDFIVHFLTEGRGYCVHFATAGAILLRMQGIPARYVSGYVADLDAQGRSTVLDSGAHAWVEIYLEGYGWYPVEMTPGYNGGISGAGLEGESGTMAPEDPGEDEPDVPPEEDGPEEIEDKSPEDTEPDTEEPGEEAFEADGPGKQTVSVIWKVLFGIAVFWAVLCAAYLLALFIRKRDREDKDTNRSVLNACGRYKRLRRWGCGEDEELERLAKKAKFSQHTLTEEERQSVWKCLDEDVKQSCIGQPVRRRWLFALLCPMF